MRNIYHLYWLNINTQEEYNQQNTSSTTAVFVNFMYNKIYMKSPPTNRKSTANHNKLYDRFTQIESL